MGDEISINRLMKRQTYLLFIVPIGDCQETLGKKDLEFLDEKVL